MKKDRQAKLYAAVSVADVVFKAVLLFVVMKQLDRVEAGVKTCSTKSNSPVSLPS
jgi:hypothetical protein